MRLNRCTSNERCSYFLNNSKYCVDEKEPQCTKAQNLLATMSINDTYPYAMTTCESTCTPNYT